MLRISDLHSRAAKKNMRDGNEVLPQDTTLFIQRPCHQRGSRCQAPAGNQTSRRPPDHRKEMQNEVVWTCLPFTKSGQFILQGILKGGRRQSRQKKRLENSNGEWTGLEFAKSQRAVENREKWSKLAVKSSVVPQRATQLRNK